MLLWDRGLGIGGWGGTGRKPRCGSYATKCASPDPVWRTLPINAKMGKRDVWDRHSAQLIPSLPFRANVWATKYLSGRYSAVLATGYGKRAPTLSMKRLNTACTTTDEPAYGPFKFFISVVQYLGKKSAGLITYGFRQTLMKLVLVRICWLCYFYGF